MTLSAVDPTITPELRILHDAGDTITGERQDQYGHPEDSFNTIAQLWTTYLQAITGGKSIQVEAKDVALMMTLLKIARETNAPKRDSILDAIGYLALTERMPR